MNTSSSRRMPVALVATAGFAVVLAVVLLQPAHAAREGEAASPAHYTVVATEGHNLIVTDNVSNTLYFYTIDKDKPIGSELKLRGSVDLNQVGKPEIMPVTHKLQQQQQQP